MLQARQLTKEYQSGDHRLAVLRDVSFTIPEGAFVAVVGPSGSGKTTLLGLLAGLDVPTRGSVLIDGDDLTRLSEDRRAQLRGAKVGFVFQSFQLIPTLTALENVQVPLELRGDDGAPARALELLGRVGLGDRAHHFPNQLSGGEQQRVAIARAFSNAPRLLFADEPTGNLDSETGARIVELLETLNRESGTTIVLVTHDLALARRAQRIIRLADGVVAIDSFASNTQRSVREQARALLGGDIALTTRLQTYPRPIILALDSLHREGVGLAQVSTFASMALVQRTGGTRLSQVRAVTPGYPFYGEIVTSPVGQWERLQSGRNALVDPTLLVALDARVGDTLTLGFAKFVIAGTLVNVPGDVAVAAAAMGPRAYIPERYIKETGLLL